MNTEKPMRALSRIDKAILIKDCDAVLKVILEHAHRLTSADTVQLYMLRGSHLVLKLSFPVQSGLVNGPFRQKLSVESSACGIATLTREVMSVPDVRLFKDLYPDASKLGFLSELIAPIWSNNDAIGAISLTSGQAKYFKDEHVPMLKALVGQAAVAIVHASVLSELEELRNLDHAILQDGMTIERIAAVVLESILRLTHAEQGNVLLLDSLGKGHLKVIATTGSAEDIGAEIALDKSVSGASIIEDKPIRIGNWREDENYSGKFIGLLENTVSELVMPMRIGRWALVLNVESQEENAFNDRHEEILADFARQAAIAVQHVVETQQTYTDLQAMTDAAIELNVAARYEKSIYQRAAELALKLTDAASCQVLVRRGSKLNVVGTTDAGLGMELLMGDCASGLIIEENAEHIVRDDLEVEPLPRFQQWAAQKTRSVLMAGIRKDDDTIGVINLESTVPGHFDERCISLIKQLAQNVGGALAINKLYEGLRHVSHDLTTHAGTLQTNVTIIQDMLGEQPPRVQEALGRVSRVALDLDSRSQDILPRDAESEPLLVYEICRHAVALVGADSVTELGEEVSNSIPPISFDFNHASRVLMHILQNSIDAMIPIDADKRKVIVWAEYEAGKEGIRLFVEDNGIGMTKRQQQDAFIPGVSRKQGMKGTGLGIPFCEQVLLSGGGSLDFLEPRPDAGTAAVITFPRATDVLLVRISLEDIGEKEVGIVLSEDEGWANQVLNVFKRQGIEGQTVTPSAFLQNREFQSRMREVVVLWADLRGEPEQASNVVAKLLHFTASSYAGSRLPTAPLPLFLPLSRRRLPQSEDLLSGIIEKSRERGEAYRKGA